MKPAGSGNLKRRWWHAGLEAMAALTRHPVISVMVGAGLLLSGTSELLDDWFTGFDSALKTYHGLILLGVVTALRGFAEVVEGIVWLSRDAEAEEEAEAAEAGAVVELGATTGTRRERAG